MANKVWGNGGWDQIPEIRTAGLEWSCDCRGRRDEVTLYLGLKSSSHFARKKEARPCAEFVSKVVYLCLELVYFFKSFFFLKILIFAVLGIGSVKDKHSSIELQSSLLDYFSRAKVHD